MAPIRKGDGTPLEIPGVQEVRSGDGRVFFEDAIPDSVVSQYLITDDDNSDTIFDEMQENDLDNNGLTFTSDSDAKSDRYIVADGDQSGAHKIPGDDFTDLDKLTVTFWTRATGIGDRAHIIGHADDGASTASGTFSWIVAGDTDSNVILFATSSDSGSFDDGVAEIDQSDVFDGSWHFVAYRFDEGSVTSFLDGGEEASGTAPDSSIPNDGDEFMIAAPSDRDRREYEGDLDDIKFFEDALTDDEIDNIRKNHPRSD